MGRQGSLLGRLCGGVERSGQEKKEKCESREWIEIEREGLLRVISSSKPGASLTVAVSVVCQTPALGCPIMCGGMSFLQPGES